MLVLLLSSEVPDHNCALSVVFFIFSQWGQGCPKATAACSMVSTEVPDHCLCCFPSLVVYDVCPKAFDAGIWWPKTKFGRPAAAHCPKGSIGRYHTLPVPPPVPNTHTHTNTRTLSCTIHPHKHKNIIFFCTIHTSSTRSLSSWTPTLSKSLHSVQQGQTLSCIWKHSV